LDIRAKNLVFFTKVDRSLYDSSSKFLHKFIPESAIKIFCGFGDRSVGFRQTPSPGKTRPDQGSKLFSGLVYREVGERKKERKKESKLIK